MRAGGGPSLTRRGLTQGIAGPRIDAAERPLRGPR